LDLKIKTVEKQTRSRLLHLRRTSPQQVTRFMLCGAVVAPWRPSKLVTIVVTPHDCINRTFKAALFILYWTDWFLIWLQCANHGRGRQKCLL